MTVFAACLALAAAACGGSSYATPTATSMPLPATATLTPDARTKAAVSSLFNTQVAAIKLSDWSAVYETCSPGFRAGRNRDRFVADATRLFASAGYTPEGFEARNVDPQVRSADRVRVRGDAYEDGQYLRTNEVGQTYIFTQGRWFDEGAWCR